MGGSLFQSRSGFPQLEVIDESGMTFGRIRDPDRGIFGIGSGRKLQALAMIIGHKKLHAETGTAVGCDIEPGIGPGVFHVGCREFRPSRKHVGGIGLNLDGLLDLAGPGEFGGRLSEIGILGDFPFSDPGF